MANLMMAALIASVMPLPSINRSPAAFCRRVIEPNCSLRAQYLASLQTTLQPYPWNAVILGLGMGERLSVPKEIKNIMRDTGTAHLMAISGLHIAFAALLAAGLIRSGQIFSARALDPLANTINWWDLLCCFLCPG